MEDILNGDYEDEGAGADDLLAEGEHADLAEMEHLN